MQLALRDVCLSYDDRRILENISFTLDVGEKALLLGPSGSGKSSLLNVICGLQSADSGDVTLDGQSMTTSSAADALRKANMGIIFQTLRLVSALTVRANLLLAQKLQNGRHDAAHVDAVLDRLGIAGKALARPFELSQGEAQRAAIARALVVRPKILIADEPTSALDAANTEIVANLLIEEAQTAGASLLIATHDDRLKEYFARTLSLSDGAIAA